MSTYDMDPTITPETRLWNNPSTPLSSSIGLQSLPDELLLEIVQKLEASARLALSWTCRRYYTALYDVDIDLLPWSSKHRQVMRGNWIIHHFDAARQMLLIERWPYYNSVALKAEESSAPAHCPTTELAPLDLFFCKSCWRLRPAEKFLTSMTSRKRKSGKMDSPDDKSQDRAYARLCIECGITRHEYKSSVALHFGRPGLTGKSGYGIVCTRCSKFAEVEDDSREKLRKTCRPCLEYRPPGTR